MSKAAPEHARLSTVIEALAEWAEKNPAD